MLFAKLYGLPTISIEEVERKLDQETLFIVDNNTKHVWSRGHVPGAVNFDPADYQESDLPADKETMLIFYCSGFFCGAAPYAAQRARKMGYPHVYVMSEGIAGWIDKNKPVEKG